jgi:sugar phosphate isomerase/epimerase
MTRRELLVGALFAPALSAKGRIDKSRISAITDEIGLTTEDSLAFAKQYGLRAIEVRAVPGSKPAKEYAFLPEAEIKEAAASFAANGLKVSFINTGLLKFTWPGMEPARQRKETDEAREKRLANEAKRFARRKEDVQQAVTAARLLGCDKLRIFTGTRVADAKAALPHVVEVLNELVPIAEAGKVHLLVENEASQNIGTSQELAEIMERMPSKWVGFNWDPQNALPLKEVPWPNGYDVLPKKRMLNIQFKGKGIMEGSPEKLDWAAIVHALQKDGYPHMIGLETHLFDGTLIQAAHTSMETMLRIVG